MPWCYHDSFTVIYTETNLPLSADRLVAPSGQHRGDTTGGTQLNIDKKLCVDEMDGLKKMMRTENCRKLLKIVEIISQSCAAGWVWGFRVKDKLSRLLIWSWVFLGRCNLLVWWWRWRRSVPPSRTDPAVCPAPVQTGILHDRGKTLNRYSKKNTGKTTKRPN